MNLLQILFFGMLRLWFGHGCSSLITINRIIPEFEPISIFDWLKPWEKL